MAILLFSGYHRLPRERMLWCIDQDVTTTLVSNSMTRNRCYTVKKYFHLVDNEYLDKKDKMYKVRPLMVKLNKKLFNEKYFIRNCQSIKQWWNTMDIIRQNNLFGKSQLDLAKKIEC